MKTTSQPSIDSNQLYQPLIPGLPDEISEQCLLHLPYPYQSLLRSVSTSWNKALTDPNFHLSKITLPHVFVFAFNKSSSLIQWQSFDPRSRRWFVLPSMPIPNSSPSVCPPAFASAAVPHRAAIYVLGGLRSDTQSPLPTVIRYSAAENKWSEAAPMAVPRSFFAAGAIGGRIYVAGGSGSEAAVERYDPETDAWTVAAGMRAGMARYEEAVVGGKMYVTEGWTWPFSFAPRGGVYDAASDTWREMREGMKEGWTGVSVVVGERLFVITEHCECRLKVYVDEDDTWRYVGGGRFPSEEVRRPFAACAAEGRIYVVAGRLWTAVGTLSEAAADGGLSVEWELVEAPQAFGDLVPVSSHVLYS
ncbi:hypothetical protein Sjap_010667 [Stephania japonica]|uniref:F-box domain-containing protein n=1 Tax=Stephania japonica TaxID=461633 RepID=A0AAP0P6N5_9MAGN